MTGTCIAVADLASITNAYYALEYTLHPLKHRDASPQEQLDVANKLRRAQQAMDILIGAQAGFGWPGDDGYGWTGQELDKLQQVEQQAQDNAGAKGKEREIADTEDEDDMHNDAPVDKTEDDSGAAQADTVSVTEMLDQLITNIQPTNLPILTNTANFSSPAQFSNIDEFGRDEKKRKIPPSPTTPQIPSKRPTIDSVATTPATVGPSRELYRASSVECSSEGLVTPRMSFLSVQHGASGEAREAGDVATREVADSQEFGDRSFNVNGPGDQTPLAGSDEMRAWLPTMVEGESSDVEGSGAGTGGASEGTRHEAAERGETSTDLRKGNGGGGDERVESSGRESRMRCVLI